MAKYVIQDTADVIITDIATGKVVLNAEAQLAGIAGSISEEDLQGGIGNKKLYKIRTDKAIDLTMRSAFADIEYWAMTQGVAVEKGNILVTEAFRGVVVEDTVTSAFEIVLPILETEVNAPATAKVTLADGTQEVLPVKTSATEPTKKAIDLATATAVPAKGEFLQAFYTVTKVGEKISIDSTKYSSKYKVEMRTIAYDPATAQVGADIYFIFPETIPSGEFDISLENGTVYTPEISFSVLNPLHTDEMGEIALVPRA